MEKDNTIEFILLSIIFGYLVELAYTDQDNVFLDYLVVMHPSCVPYAV